MKKYSLGLFTAMILLSVSLTSCEAIGSIFKAGMWVGVIGVVLLVVIIFWLISKTRRKE